MSLDPSTYGFGQDGGNRPLIRSQCFDPTKRNLSGAARICEKTAPKFNDSRGFCWSLDYGIEKHMTATDYSDYGIRKLLRRVLADHQPIPAPTCMPRPQAAERGSRRELSFDEILKKIQGEI